MPACRNPKHERYAIGLSKGLTQVEAYQRAGYKGSRAAASNLAGRMPIRNRVKELIDEALRLEEGTRAARNQARDAGEPTLITKDYMTLELLKNLDDARSLGNAPAANKALELLARLHNLIKPDPERNLPNKRRDKDDPPHAQLAPTVNLQVVNQVAGRYGGATSGSPTDGAITLTEVEARDLPALADGGPDESDGRIDGVADFLRDAVSDDAPGGSE